MILPIDYKQSIFTFKGTRKHFFRDRDYYISVFPTFFVMGEKPECKKPKYYFELVQETKIQWDSKKEPTYTDLICFWFNYQTRIKAMHCRHLDLVKFKELIQDKVTFVKITEIYAPLAQLGKGSSARVFKARNLLNSKFYAVKAIEKAYLQQSNDGNGMLAFQQEIDIMRHLNKPDSFIRLHEMYEGESTYYLVLNLLNGPSLSDELDRVKVLFQIYQTTQEKRFSVNDIRIIMRKLLTNVKLLHENGVIHRDLKPDNLMFAQEGDLSSLILLDFGLATFQWCEKFVFPKCGTPGYVAPEVFNCKPGAKYDTKADMFSVGCLFHKLLTGRSVFSGQTFDEILKANKKCQIDLDLQFDSHINEASLSLLRMLLHKNHKLRMSAEQALNHPFFANQPQSQFTQELPSSQKLIQSKYTLKPLIKEEQESKYDSKSELPEKQAVQHIPDIKRMSLISEIAVSPNRMTMSRSKAVSTSIHSFYQKDRLNGVRKVCVQKGPEN